MHSSIHPRTKIGDLMSPSVQSMQFAGLKSCDTTDDTIMTTIFPREVSLAAAQREIGPGE